MRLIDNWQAVLRYSWSARFMALSLAVLIAEPVFTALIDLVATPSVWLTVGLRVVSGLLAFAGIYARVVAQREIETVVTPSGVADIKAEAKDAK